MFAGPGHSALSPASRRRETPAEEGNRPEGTKDRLGDFTIKQDSAYTTVFYVVLICAPKPFLLCKPPGMHYVYIIVSVTQPERYYVGLTENVRQRLGHHNQGIVVRLRRSDLGGYGQRSASLSETEQHNSSAT